jgi:NAD(P)H-flavin reductase
MNLSYTPPPGYAYTELLAGHTIRLTLTPARQFSWAPGQHFLLLVPHVSSILTHPFTTASCYDKLLPDQEGALVFLIRAKGGWTRELWNTIAVLTSQGKHVPPGEQLPQGWAPPKKGVVMRALVDGPFGSSGRVRWDNYSTAIICVGGSGISFGLSVLEHLCLRMAGRDAASLAGKGSQMKMRRVRFVWLIREYCE